MEPDVAVPERRCLVTRRKGDQTQLLRFVLDPERRVRLDLEQRLPGRGMWLSAERDVLNKAVSRNLFAKAARGPARAEPGLCDEVERLLVKRALGTIGLARRAGQVAAGFQQVQDALRSGTAAVIVEAVDGSPDGRRKLRRLSPDLPLIVAFSSAELGAALGREATVHVVIAPGRLAQRLIADVERLSGFRPESILWPRASRTPPGQTESRAATGPQ
jgi:predicted RNA-binding protein YlxR (DUF448 family)/ribosomal protein L30E